LKDSKDFDKNGRRKPAPAGGGSAKSKGAQSEIHGVYLRLSEAWVNGPVADASPIAAVTVEERGLYKDRHCTA
jgi:hypothetical protein